MGTMDRAKTHYQSLKRAEERGKTPASMAICFTSSSRVAYKPLPPIKNIFTRASFFSCFFLHFHRTPFRGLAGAYVNPTLLVHSLVCPITHSSLDDFSQTWFSTSPMYALPVILFSAKRKYLNVFMKGYYTAGWFCYNLDPRQMICINFWLHNLYWCIILYWKLKKIAVLSFSKLSFKVESAYMLL